MSGSEERRLVAWHRELSAAHDRLRAALRLAQELLPDRPESASRDLRLYCLGFCAALAGHHAGEDAVLFPRLSAAHPRLRDTIDKLTQDHSMISYLLGQLDVAIQSQRPTDELSRHLEGIAAIMESHFGYEERQLREVLSGLELDASIEKVFGLL